MLIQFGFFKKNDLVTIIVVWSACMEEKETQQLNIFHLVFSLIFIGPRSWQWEWDWQQYQEQSAEMYNTQVEIFVDINITVFFSAQHNCDRQRQWKQQTSVPVTSVEPWKTRSSRQRRSCTYLLAVPLIRWFGSHCLTHQLIEKVDLSCLWYTNRNVNVAESAIENGGFFFKPVVYLSIKTFGLEDFDYRYPV